MKKHNVLLIDTDEKSNNLIKEKLEAETDFVVTISDDYGKAISKLYSNHDFDVVLIGLDNNLENYLSDFKKQKDRIGSIPVIFLLTEEQEEFGKKAILSGAQDYIVKKEICYNLLKRCISNSIVRKSADLKNIKVKNDLETELRIKTADLIDKKKQLEQEITSRMWLEQELVYSNTQMKRILESTLHVSIIATDVLGNITFFNKGAESILGYCEDEMVGVENINKVHLNPEENSFAQKICDTFKHTFPNYEELVEAAKKGIFKKEECIYFRKDNTYRILSIIVSSMHFDDKVISGFLSVGTDITDRKLYEVAIKESEEQLRTFFAYTPAAVAMLDTNMSFLMVSKRWLSEFWLKEEDIIGQNYYEIFPDTDNEMKQMHQLCLNGAVESREDDVFKTPNGKEEIVRWEIRPWRYSDKKIGGLVIFIEIITERKLTEKELEDSEARYRGIVEDQTELVCRFFPDWNLSFVNNTFSRFFNKERSDLLGKPFDLLILEEDIQYKKQALPKINVKNPVVSFEHRTMSKEGKIRWLHWTNRAIFDTNGEIFEFQSTGRDITERREAEEALKDSEERYRTLIGNISDIIILLDSNREIIYASNSIERIAGFKSVDVIGHDLCDYIFEGDVEIIKQIFSESLDNPSVEYYAEARATQIQKNKQVGYFEFVFYNQLYTPGIEGIILTLRNITERKQAESALRENEKMLQKIIDNSPTVVYLKDIKGKYVLVNQKFVELCSLSKKEILGKTNYDIFPDDIATEMTENDKDVINAGISKRYEEELPLSGILHTYLSIRFPLIDKDCNVYSICSISTDISTRKKMEKQLRISQKKAEAASKLKSEFLANVSHELRTPLNALINFSRAIAEEIVGELNDEQKDLAQRLVKNSRYLLDLINELLDISKIESGQIELNPSDVNIGDFEKTVKDAAQSYLKPEVKLNINIQKGTFCTDKKKLEQIIINLISNACKFTEKGNVSIDITFDHKFLYILVKDTGIGIEKDFVNRIFEKFVQASNVSHIKGTGLGLPIVKELIRLLSGNITVESQPGVGTSFNVKIKKLEVEEAF